MFAGLALLAAVVEALVGYPDPVYRRIGHPVTWIGRLIARCDRSWNAPTLAFAARRRHGVATLLLLLALALGAGLLIERLCLGWLPPPVAVGVTAVLASSLLAQRSLHAHVLAVAEALERDGLEAGRRAVAHIVGRETAGLDAGGVSRAAIESLAESFSDGVVAPLFWLAVLGLPGALAYKAVNTADSMIGHLDDRHRAFGWAAARFDDLVNLPAARMASLLLVLAAPLVSGSPARAVAVLRRDARRHRSPNAGWPEAAMAGALEVRLGGPATYEGELHDRPVLGEGQAPEAADLRKGLSIYRRALALTALALLAGGLAWPR